MITCVELKHRITYDPGTGAFMRNNGRAITASKSKNGYTRIWVAGKHYYAHRLAWLYMTGSWPLADIDHINRVRTDNRWVNLRLATRSQNMANTLAHRDSTYGTKGVCWHSAANKWMAQIQHQGKYFYLGLFDAIDDAKAAYNTKAVELFGQFTEGKLRWPVM